MWRRQAKSSHDGTTTVRPRRFSPRAIRLKLEALETRQNPGFLSPVSYAVGGVAVEPAIADVNGDGNPDVVVARAGEGGGMQVRLGAAGCTGVLGASSQYAGGANPNGARLGDLDGDGDLDLVTGNFTAPGTINVLLNNGNGTFAAGVEYPTGGDVSHHLDLGDTDNDGDLDVAVSNYNTANVSVLRNNGNGTFGAALTLATGIGPVGVELGDLNGDGAEDLTVDSQLSDTVTVWRSNGGDGTWSKGPPQATGESPFGHDLADMDNNGTLDLITNGFNSNVVSVARGTGGSRFRPRTDFVSGDGPTWPRAGDIDNNGDLDLIVSNYNAGTLSTLLGNGNLTFQPKTDHPSIPDVARIAVGDLTCDGFDDVVLTEAFGGTLAVMINDGSWPSPVPPPPVGDIDLGGPIVPDVRPDGLTSAPRPLQAVNDAEDSTSVAPVVHTAARLLNSQQQAEITGLFGDPLSV